MGAIYLSHVETVAPILTDLDEFMCVVVSGIFFFKHTHTHIHTNKLATKILFNFAQN